jgi:hypothetical protein
MKLEPELRAEFIAEAEAAHRPASQVVRELMREFVQRQRQAREYEEFLRHKVEAAGARCAPVWVDRMTRLKPNSPRGVPMLQSRREGYLDPGRRARPQRYLGLHRSR